MPLCLFLARIPFWNADDCCTELTCPRSFGGAPCSRALLQYKSATQQQHHSSTKAGTKNKNSKIRNYIWLLLTW